MFRFNKKKKEEDDIKPNVNLEYHQWDLELGFLHNIMNNIFNNTVSNKAEILSQKLINSNTNDDDLKTLTVESVSRVYTIISESYTDFLINKYFNDKEGLTIYISEEFYFKYINIMLKLNLEKNSKSLLPRNVNNPK